MSSAPQSFDGFPELTTEIQVKVLNKAFSACADEYTIESRQYKLFIAISILASVTPSQEVTRFLETASNARTKNPTFPCNLVNFGAGPGVSPNDGGPYFKLEEKEDGSKRSIYVSRYLYIDERLGITKIMKTSSLARQVGLEFFKDMVSAFVWDDYAPEENVEELKTQLLENVTILVERLKSGAPISYSSSSQAVVRQEPRGMHSDVIQLNGRRHLMALKIEIEAQRKAMTQSGISKLKQILQDPTKARHLSWFINEPDPAYQSLELYHILWDDSLSAAELRSFYTAKIETVTMQDETGSISISLRIDRHAKLAPIFAGFEAIWEQVCDAAEARNTHVAYVWNSEAVFEEDCLLDIGWREGGVITFLQRGCRDKCRRNRGCDAVLANTRYVETLARREIGPWRAENEG